MNDIKSLCHSVWDCKYHVVFIPKCRRRVIYGKVRKYLGEVFRDLARQRESTIEEGHLMVDHVHMLISIPPKYSVAQVIGFLKGKSTIHIARRLRNKRNVRGEGATHHNSHTSCGLTGLHCETCDGWHPF